MTLVFDIIITLLLLAVIALIYFVFRRLGAIQTELNAMFDALDEEIPQMVKEAVDAPYVGEDGLYSYDNLPKRIKKEEEGELSVNE